MFILKRARNDFRMKNKEKIFRHNNLRKSNFELLRLVAMFFIICHHLVIRSAQTCGYTHPFNINEDVLGGGGLVI
jgi:hypothetical protein